MKIFQQAGHNTNWNIDSINDDVAGSGIIFSPVHFARDRIESLNGELKEVSLFDPQFYVPDSQKIKLHSYDFFPERLLGGFSTDSFEAKAFQAAENCVSFQIENKFNSLIIPARYHDELISDYIKKQKVFSVEPFLEAIKLQGTKHPVFLTLPLTAAMLQDQHFRINILNWVTEYPRIDGVYLLVNFETTSKQIQDFDKLYAYSTFVRELGEAGLKVICGYLNTEGIVISTLAPYAVTIGAYENTRNFSIDKFLESDRDVRGPAPRIYFPNLLNWIRYATAKEIREDHPGLWDKVYTPTKYSEKVFSTPKDPHFSQPDLYKHHFNLVHDQYREIEQRSRSDRVSSVIEIIKAAHALYKEIEDEGILFFDSNCSGEHLAVWNRVLKKLSTEAGS